MITRLLLVLMRRPRGVALLAMGLVLAGLLGLRNMPVSAIPSVDLPTILVTGALPGASPEAMARLVAAPLEGALGTISGVTEISAVNVEGLSRIVLQFGPERDISAAARDVQAAISTVRDRLPADMPTPPIYQKINPSEAPALFLAVTSDAFPAERLYDCSAEDLSDFLAFLDNICSFVGTPEELAEAAEHAALESGREHILYSEMILNPTHWPQFSVPEIIAAVTAGFDRAAAGFGFHRFALQVFGFFANGIGGQFEQLGSGHQLLLRFADQQQRLFQGQLPLLNGLHHVRAGFAGLHHQGLQAFLKVEQVLVVQRLIQALVHAREFTLEVPIQPALDEAQGQ